LSFAEPDRLVMVWEQNLKQGYDENAASLPNYVDWKNQNQVFEKMAGFTEAHFNLTGSDEPVRIEAASVSSDFFPVLGINPKLGRTFLLDEERLGHTQVVVLSHGLWQRRFGADPALVGNTVA